MVNLVLIGCNDILLERNHIEIFCNSVFTKVTNSPRLGPEASRVVSSQNSKIKSRVYLGRSFMNIRKRIGPSIEPCGKPKVIARRVDLTESMQTNCFLSIK